MRQIVDLVYATLLEDEDGTVHIPAEIAKLAYAPIDKLNR